MAGNMKSALSVSARRRKRNESDEAYEKRLARLEQKRESEARRRLKVAEAPSTQEKPANREQQERMAKVLERSLEEQAADRAMAESQVSALVKQLERERAEHARQLEALKAALRGSSGIGEPAGHNVDYVLGNTAQIHHGGRVSQVNDAVLGPNSSEGVETIDLTGDRGQNPSSHEIIELFDDRGQGSEFVSTMQPKSLISKAKADAEPLPESDPAFITPSGYKSGATHRAENGFGADGGSEEDQTETPRTPPMTLAEASEMVLLLGWLESARRAYPEKTLVLRFGATERRLWRDVTSAAAEFCGGADLDASSGPIPFVRVLALTLRYVLDRLPPAAPLSDVCLSCGVNLARPHPRGPGGWISNLENVDDVKRIFEHVRQEVATGTLVIVEGDR